jgi:Flp pilus assembly protein TadG
MSRGTSADRGAAALEFALVVPVLCILVFGMVDYGLFFSDSLGARDGTRIAARRGAVADFPACAGGVVPTGDDDKLNKLACLAVSQTGASGGDAYARVTVPGDWAPGRDVLVCVAIVETGVTGFTPMPNNSTVRAKLRMRIEQDTGNPPSRSNPGMANKSTAPPAPPGLWTQWCV